MTDLKILQPKAGVAAVLLLAASLLTAGVAQAQQVGTAAAVNPSAQARGSGGSRTIVLGQSIAHRERIQTTSAGSVQLLFLDKTSMTIGPNSDLAIDEYVYDPATNSGKLAATLSKGVMRFVGGQISHQGNAQVTTPSAVVGIRGGVALFQFNSIFLAYGQGEVKSGGVSQTLNAGDFIQTFGSGAPPTSPGAPPANFVQSVIGALQSQGGQGGGAGKSGGQVNQARVNATGSATGNIAANVQNVTNQPLNIVTQNNAASNINQTIQTTNVQSSVAKGAGDSVAAESLTGFTGGINQVSNGNQGPSQPGILLGAATFKTDPSRDRAQANFDVVSVGLQNNNNNPVQFGSFQYGSTDPSQPASNATITQFEDVIGQVRVLLPAVTASGTPVSTTNGAPVSQQNGVLFEVKQGTKFAQSAQQVLGGTPFCECEFTRWGFWGGDFSQGSLRQSIEAFWVAGRMPEEGSIASQGTATYTGHVAAQIQNNGNGYAASGKFVNTVNFGTRSGNFTISNLDFANYQGTIALDPNDPRSFAGAGQGSHERLVALYGNFFRNSASQFGEMGGGLFIVGNNYLGSGIFIAKK